MRVSVKLYAMLGDYLPSGARDHRIDLDLAAAMSVSEVVRELRLPAGQVHLVLLNGVYVEPEARAHTRLAEGDVLALWPPIAGG